MHDHPMKVADSRILLNDVARDDNTNELAGLFETEVY